MNQKIYYVELRSPTRNIKEYDAEIRVCNKFTWAIFKNRKGRHTRSILGSSSFYSRAAAERCKLAKLIQICNSKCLSYLAAGAYTVASIQLSEYKKTGIIK